MMQFENISRGYSNKTYENIINAFSVDSKIKRNTNSAFHYTSFENCIKMLKPQDDGNDETYLELFASHFNFMNDTKEFLEGLEHIVLTLKGIDVTDQQIKNTIEDFRKQFEEIHTLPYNSLPPHYIISFNTECNSLAQWKYYGKNCGVAIEYDLNNCKYSNFSLFDEYVSHDSYYVNYNKEEQKMEIEKILNNIIKLDSNSEKNKGIHCKNILLQACAAASFMKDKNYIDENEVRLLFAPYYMDNSPETSTECLHKLMKKVEYRPRGTEYIIPYLRIRLKSKIENKYPIKSLTVGPGQNQELIYNSLIMFVQSNFQKSTSFNRLPDEEGCSCVEVNGIKIRKSLIPFRG